MSDEYERRGPPAGLTEQDRDYIRALVEFVLYCQHESPRSGEVACVAPVAKALKERLGLKMVHYDREHPEGA